MDIMTILTRKYPDEAWELIGTEYSGLVWFSNSAKPTEAHLNQLWPQVQAEIAAEAQAKIDAKASAITKLQALGLTVEEVSAAFGLEA